MKKALALLAALLLMAGCSDNAAIGVIGGADGPTDIIIAGNPLPSSSSSESESSSSESEPASSSSESTPESKAESKPESKSESKAESKPESNPESKSEAPPASSSSAVVTSGDTEYLLSASKVKAGDMVTLTVKNAPEFDTQDGLVVEATVSGNRWFYKDGDDAIAFVAVSRNTALGNYKVTVKQEGKVVAEFPLTVVDAGFASESFEMAAGTVNDTVNSNKAREEYNRITADVMAIDTAEPYYPDTDGFVFPLQVSSYRVSSSYGFTRIVNGKVSGRHEGIDFPAPKGTPVLAAGDGKVLYSGLMQMTGNTVIIEHGMGLKSWYHHMDSLNCETGDTVKAGDLIGKVGTTGYSTGNHLHFGMSVFDTYTNPWQFIPKTL